MAPGWRTVRLSVLALVVVVVGTLAGAVGAQPIPPLPPGEPWEEEPPDVVVPGKETEEGAEFETPFLVGVTALLAQFVDCSTGAAIAPEAVETDYYFADGATPPYEVGELERVVVWALGYVPKEITQFETFSLPILFFTITVLYPAGGQIVCLQPSSGSVAPVFVEDDVAPGPPPPLPAPPPAPGTCGAQEAERKVWKVVYHPTSVLVERGQNAKGGLETTFRMNFDRETFWKTRDRGACSLTAGHPGAHSPWDWSAWREDGSEIAPVTFTQTIGGWPDGMSASYFEGWVVSACYADLAARGLPTLRYITNSFDAKAYYELHIDMQLEMG